MSQMSTTSLGFRHDGHREGHLNCLAVRHGWTRTFSISPDELPKLTYAALERLLELPTLRLRPLQVRIFVEHPRGSGTFAKIRQWRDDGSLQSVLVQRFFQDRCAEGGMTTFELRDGRDRPEDDDGNSIASGLSRFRSMRSKRSFDASAENDAPPSAPPKSGAVRFFDFFRFTRSVKPQPPVSAVGPKHLDESDDEGDAPGPSRPLDEEEQALLRKRGWMPPMFRKISSSRKVPTATPEPAPPEEELEEWEHDVEAGPDETYTTAHQARPGIFQRMSSSRKNGGAAIGLSKKRKDKPAAAKKGKGRAFVGAERISRPDEALPPPTPEGKNADPFQDQD